MNKDIEINGNMNLGAYSPLELTEEEINEALAEKAVSKAQQRFFGMVDAYKKGDMPDASPAIKKAAKGMTKKEVKDFAKTKHKGLPEHVDENVIAKLVHESVENLLVDNNPTTPVVDFSRSYGMDGKIMLGHYSDGRWFVYNKANGKSEYFQSKEEAEAFAEQLYKDTSNDEYLRRQQFNKEVSMDESKLRKLVKETVQQHLVDVMAKYVKGEASSEEANKAIMDLANSGNGKMNENLDPKTANYFEQIKRGERDSLEYNGQIYEVTPQLRKLAQQISEQFGLEVYPYVYQNDVRIFCALEIQNNGDEINYDTIRELENELSKYGLHCAASFGTKYMTYVKQIREKNR